jgi:hypothetical protein
MDALELEKIISEPKIISVPPKKEFKEECQHLRNDFGLTSLDGTKKFSVFLRRNANFQENFSIGLIYCLPEGGNVQLIRLNGNHGEVVEDILRPSPHFGYHIHKISHEELDRGLSDPKFSHETKEYASFEQALNYFFTLVNIKDAEKYFNFNDQLNLFKDSDLT